MDKCYLDTNVLVYFADEESSFHLQAKELIKKAIFKRQEFIISSLVVDEFIYVMRGYSLQKKKKEEEVHSSLKRVMQKIFHLPRIKILQPPTSFSSQLLTIDLMHKYTLKPRDAFHLLTVIHHKIQYLCTFDTDFEKVFRQGKIKPL